MSDIRYEVRNGIAVVTFDNRESKVNILSAAVLKELDAVLERVQKEPAGLKALFFESAKPRIFIAGADIKEIEQISTLEEAEGKSRAGQAILDRIEDLPVPTG